MPSSHAANWFAATMILFIYYRRSVWFMLPGAILVGFSRIYNGVHYPSDVLAGAILGAGYAAASVWSLNALWQWAGRKWFPLWWEKFPSLLDPAQREKSDEEENRVSLSPIAFGANTSPPCPACHPGPALGAVGLPLHRGVTAGAARVYRQRNHPTVPR